MPVAVPEALTDDGFLDLTREEDGLTAREALLDGGWAGKGGRSSTSNFATRSLKDAFRDFESPGRFGVDFAALALASRYCADGDD